MKQLILNKDKEIACIYNCILLPMQTLIETNTLLNLPVIQYLNSDLNKDYNENDIICLSTPKPNQKTPENLSWLKIDEILNSTKINKEEIAYLDLIKNIINRM